MHSGCCGSREFFSLRRGHKQNITFFSSKNISIVTFIGQFNINSNRYAYTHVQWAIHYKYILYSIYKWSQTYISRDIDSIIISVDYIKASINRTIIDPSSVHSFLFLNRYQDFWKQDNPNLQNNKLSQFVEYGRKFDFDSKTDKNNKAAHWYVLSFLPY